MEVAGGKGRGKMTLEIEIDSRVAAWLEDEAARQGRSPGEIIQEILAERATPTAIPTAMPEVDFAALRAQLPRRSAEDRRQMALEQGASLAIRPEDLCGNFWPEGKSEEEEVLAMHAQLPQGTREELRELAIQQGASLALSPKDLQGGGWPEDESIDEFIAEIRALRR